jgi:hypothetical protein
LGGTTSKEICAALKKFGSFLEIFRSEAQGKGPFKRNGSVFFIWSFPIALMGEYMHDLSPLIVYRGHVPKIVEDPEGQIIRAAWDFLSRISFWRAF